MKKFKFMLILFSTLSLAVKSQTLFKVFHGANGETQVYDNSDKQVSKPTIRLSQGDVFTIKVINPNPILYNYTLKYESITTESEDKAITDLLSSFNSILSFSANAAFGASETDIDRYKKAIDTLTRDINDAKNYIRQSDKPELPVDALQYGRAAGLRYALDKISSMPSTQYHLNSSSLLNDLNTLSAKAYTDERERQAFTLLNSSLVEKVHEIKKQTSLQTTQTVWQKDFKVTDSSKRVFLVIHKIDKSNASLIRDGSGDKDFQIELGTVIPYYKRATLELVPVSNFIFSKDVKEFYLDNNVVQSRKKTKTTVDAGVVLNVNFARFGESKEMAVGIGPGYKFNATGEAFENFYLSTLFSYKNFLRIGFGFGFAQFPSDDLKQGVKVGQPLPTNISNFSDLIQYEEKPSAFLTISFTGLNLTKKK